MTHQCNHSTECGNAIWLDVLEFLLTARYNLSLHTGIIQSEPQLASVCVSEKRGSKPMLYIKPEQTIYKTSQSSFLNVCRMCPPRYATESPFDLWRCEPTRSTVRSCGLSICKEIAKDCRTFRTILTSLNPPQHAIIITIASRCPYNAVTTPLSAWTEKSLYYAGR